MSRLKGSESSLAKIGGGIEDGPRGRLKTKVNRPRLERRGPANSRLRNWPPSTNESGGNLAVALTQQKLGQGSRFSGSMKLSKGDVVRTKLVE